MASLPESSTFDAGVYQLELTDPVIGGPSGVSNTPLKNLANRTKYLKDHVDALESSRAPLASPALTGAPTAPTAAQGTSTTQVATTAFVNAEIAADAAPISHVGATGAAHGVATGAAAGFMSAADKSKLDGIAAGAQANTVVSVAGKTGAVALAVTDVSGAAPSASPALTGTPTAPTANQGANTAQVATTAFVKAEIATDVGSTNSPLVKAALNASGGAPIFAARAWVNFNARNTAAIRWGGNISSIEDMAVGDVRINFLAAMPDVNYAVAASFGDVSSTAYFSMNVPKNQDFSTGFVRIGIGSVESYAVDATYCSVVVFR